MSRISTTTTKYTCDLCGNSELNSDVPQMWFTISSTKMNKSQEIPNVKHVCNGCGNTLIKLLDGMGIEFIFERPVSGLYDIGPRIGYIKFP